MRKKLHFLLSLVVLTLFASVTANAQGLEDGKYYLLNVASGKYWGAGNSWGTQASLVKHPEYVTLIGNEDGTYKLDSQVSNTLGKDPDNDHYFNGDFMDNGTPMSLTITASGDYYTIADGTACFGYDGESTVLGKELEADSKNALWSIISEADMIASLANATAENPVDATFLILDPNFGRNNRNKGAWTAEASNKNLGGGANDNFCAESYHSTFALSQIIENAPKGVYKLTAQGFYRQDGTDNDNLPYIYLNDEKGGTFPLKTGSENNMSDASNSFTKGLYAIDPAYIELSEDGSLTVGAKLETNTTLWCIWDNFELTYYGTEASITEIKLGGLVASVKALREEATALKGNENVHANTITVLEKALADSEEIEATEDAYNAAIDALTAAINQANKDVTTKTAINAMYDILNNNVATSEAAETYKALADKYLEGFNEGTLTENVVNPTTITGWHANPLAVSDFLISAWDEATAYNWDSYHVNTWSTEGETDGSNFKVPFIEYWTGDGESLKAKELTATVEDVEPGMYAVSAWVRVRAKNNVEATEATGITLSVNDGEAVDVTEGEQIGNSQFIVAEYTAIATVGEDGKLVIKFNVAEETNISWLSFKNVKYTATTIEEVNYKKALATITNGNYYRVYTTVDEKDYYLKADGKLTADVAEAKAFEFKAVVNGVSGSDKALYETGWNLGCKFTNPDTGSATGAVKQVGGIRVDSKNDRDVWERQVFFYNGKEYAVRSTNAGGENWGANTYWTVFTDTELPTAGHGVTGVQHYVWQLKDVTAEALLAAAKAVVEAKTGVGNGLFYIPEEAYNTYAEAVAAAEAIITNEESTAEEIAKAVADLKAAGETYAATPRTAPVEGQAYIIANATAEGNLCVGKDTTENGDKKITVDVDAKVYFTAVTGGYAISNEEGEYIFKTTTSNNTWTLSTTTDLASAYVLTVNTVDGGYTLQGKNGLLGTDNTSAGSEVYANKAIGNNGLWTIEEYVEPTPEITFKNTPLTQDMFKTWDGFDASAKVVGENPYWDAAELGTTLEGGGVVYGSGNVTNTDYADISAADVLRIEGTPGTALRVMFNRQADDSLTELNPTIGEDGYVDVDLTSYEYVHLNAIKINWGAAGAVTALILNPITEEGQVFAIEIAATENGTVTADVEEAEAGTTVTLTVTPAEGYELDELTVVTYGENKTAVEVTEAEDGTYTFTMPEDAVTVTATFAEIPVIAGTTYEGFLAENGFHRAMNMSMGDCVEAQTVVIADPVDGVTSITFSGINFAGNIVPMPVAIPEFTIANVIVTENADGSVSYTCDDAKVYAPRGNMAPAEYAATLVGTKASADATPVITVTLTEQVILTAVFAATEEEATGINSVGADAVKANGKYLENGKVVIIRNGVKYSVNGAVVK